MNIRESSAQDKLAIAKFGKVEWRDADIEHFGSSDVVFDPKPFTFIAEDNGKMIGYIKIAIDMGVCKIDSIITAKAYRGKGAGKLLMQTAEEKAQAKGCHKLVLTTGADWEARKFYESLGYSVAATLKNHYGNMDFVYMEKFFE